MLFRCRKHLSVLALKKNIYMHIRTSSVSGGDAILCLYLRGNCLLFHLLKGINDCFPCGMFGTSKPTTQHLVLATFIVSTVVLLDGTKFVIFQPQLHSKRMPIHYRIQSIRELLQKGRGCSCWWRNDKVISRRTHSRRY